MTFFNIDIKNILKNMIKENPSYRQPGMLSNLMKGAMKIAREQHPEIKESQLRALDENKVKEVMAESHIPEGEKSLGRHPKTTEEMVKELTDKGLIKGMTANQFTRQPEKRSQLLDMMIENNLPLERDKIPPRREKTHNEMVKELEDKGYLKGTNLSRYKNVEKEGPAAKTWLQNKMKEHNLPIERDVPPSVPLTPQETSDELKKFQEQRNVSRQRTRTPVAPEVPVQTRINDIENAVAGNANPVANKPILTRQQRLEQLKANKKETRAEQIARLENEMAKSDAKKAARATTPGTKTIRFAESPQEQPAVQGLRNTLANVTGNPELATMPLTDTPYQQKLRSKSPSRLGTNIPQDDPYSALPPGMAEQILESQRKHEAKMAENAALPPDVRKINGTEEWGKLVNEKGLGVYNRPTEFLKGEDILTPLQPREHSAREMLDAQSPFSDKSEEEYEALRKQISPYVTDQTSLNASAPYLNRMSEHPDALHESLFGEIERNHFDRVREESNKNFNENILPNIQSKYQLPGLIQHGHRSRDINQASENHTKALESEIGKQRGVFRGMSLEAAQKYAQQQAAAAHVSSEAANRDRTNNLEAMSMAAAAKKENDVAKTMHRTQERELGLEDRQMKEAQRHSTVQNYYRQQREEAEKVKELSNTVMGHPVPSPGPYTPIAPPPSTAGSTSMNIAQGLMSAGAGMMPRKEKKKGGRVHKAYGGIVNPAEIAIQNAMVQKSDPIYELRRLMNLPDPVQQYAIGGMVSPIEAGATEAKKYAGDAAMQNRLARMREIPQEHAGTRFVDDFMRGMSGGTGWMAKGAEGYMGSVAAHDARSDKNRAQRDAADQLEYDLEQKIADRAHKERDMLRQEKLAEAQMGHMGAQNAHLGLQGKKLEYDMSQPKPIKLNRADQESLLSAGKTVRHAADLKQDLNRMQELSKKLNTGSIPTNWLGMDDPAKLAKFAGGSQADWDEYIKLSRSLSTKAASVFSNRSGVGVVKLFQEENPNILMTPDAIKRITDKMKFQINRAEDRAYAIHEAEKMGINPSYAEMEFDRKMQEEDEAREAEAKKNGVRPTIPAKESVNTSASQKKESNVLSQLEEAYALAR